MEIVIYDSHPEKPGKVVRDFSPLHFQYFKSVYVYVCV